MLYNASAAEYTLRVSLVALSTGKGALFEVKGSWERANVYLITKFSPKLYPSPRVLRSLIGRQFLCSCLNWTHPFDDAVISALSGGGSFFGAI